MSDEPRYHTRHEYIAKTGRRISRGAWERLNKVHDVHIQPGKFKVVAFDDGGKPQVAVQLTNVLKPETPASNRKLKMRDRFGKNEKRDRFQGEAAGIVKF